MYHITGKFVNVSADNGADTFTIQTRGIALAVLIVTGTAISTSIRHALILTARIQPVKNMEQDAISGTCLSAGRRQIVWSELAAFSL